MASTLVVFEDIHLVAYCTSAISGRIEAMTLWPYTRRYTLDATMHEASCHAVFSTAMQSQFTALQVERERTTRCVQNGIAVRIGSVATSHAYTRCMLLSWGRVLTPSKRLGTLRME